MSKKSESQTTTPITRRRFVYSAALGGLVAGTALRSRPALGAGKIKLRYVSIFDKSSPFAWFYTALAAQAKEMSAGDIEIEWAGGPELIKPFQAPEAVGKGVIDIAFSTFSYYTSVVPESIAIQASMWTLAGVHQSGMWAATDELHRKKMGVAMLGIPQSGVEYTVLMTKPVSKIEDFKGRKLRSLPIYDPLFKGLGVATVTLSPTEVYTALERGVVDGCGWPEWPMVSFRFHEVAKYLVQPNFHHALANHLMTAKKLEELPKDVHDVLIKASRKTDELGRAHIQSQRDQELAKMKGDGLVVNRLSAEDGKKYVQIANDGFWEKLIKDSPQDGPRLRDLMAKAGSIA